MTLLQKLQAIATALEDIISKVGDAKAALTDLNTFLSTF